jgi:hypothetical protein
MFQEIVVTEPIDIDPIVATGDDRKSDRISHHRLCVELRLHNKTVVFDALDAAGIATVVVSFDGYGDSGQIERVEVEGAVDALPAATVEIATAIWGELEPQRQSMSLADAIEKLIYDFLGSAHDGWEDNDGAYGEFTFDVADRTIRLDYNERYTASVKYSHEF